MCQVREASHCMACSSMVLVLVLASVQQGHAGTNISPIKKYAWIGNAGWTNWRANGITVGTTFMAGYVWGENVGWIHVGDGNAPYGNTDNTNYGINILPDGTLSGYAWAENVGWINFGIGSVWDGIHLDADRPRFDDAVGRLRGYAWGENIGWINLDDAVHFVEVPECGDGVPHAGEGCDDGNTADGDGCSFACLTEEECSMTNECGDQDGDTIRDEECAFWGCSLSGFCSDTGRVVPTDMGGAFGACPNDGFCNIHDRSHVLTCFANTNLCASINIDGSRAFGECGLDGFCNIHDANASLACFAGTNTCMCGAAPEGPGGAVVVGESSLLAVANQRSVSPGEAVEVRVFLGGNVATFQSYQLHLAATGGRSGQLKLVDITIENRRDYVFGGQDGYEAVNLTKEQMLNGIDAIGIDAPSNGYLATFTYRVSNDTSGVFVVDILSNESNGDQTFLVAELTKKVEVSDTSPAVIQVGQRAFVPRGAELERTRR